MSDSPKPLDLALQGGGAHGAFTWGVLDRLLEDGDLTFEAVSGTSAGAVNATVMAYGLHTGGHDGARSALENFWRETSRAGSIWSPVSCVPMDIDFGGKGLLSDMTYTAFDTLTRAFSPYQYNPFDINPLRDLLEKTIDFEQLAACKEIKLFLSATNVRTGRGKVFETKDVTLDVVMASSCLPFLFKAVEIDGEHYWDGGYMGNPVLWPFFYNCACRDVLIVHINPMEREELPKSAPDILNRINEISFNSSLINELRAINFVSKLVTESWLKDEFKDRLRNFRVHSIRSDKALEDLSVASKFDVNWAFLTDLKERGRMMAENWLAANRQNIGERSSVDLKEEFLTELHSKHYHQP